ncbi:GNAT family N-acetyltransferase [Chloroflexota bacterium]
MKIDTRDIDKQVFESLPPACKGCLYWEAPEKFGRDDTGKPRVPEDEAREIKRGWFDRVSRTFGSCGKILYVDDKAAGYAQFTKPHFMEKVTEYSRELFPPSPDGILLSCLYVPTEYRGKGLGTRLLQSVIEDLRGRGCQALETYSRDDSGNGNSGPTILYLENGFKQLKTKKWGDATFSLVRLELASEQ